MPKRPAKLTHVPPSKDPTLPTRIVPTAAGDIRLCLDFGALIDAEEALIAAGHKDVSVLTSMQADTASALRTFFVLAAQRFHDGMSVDELKALVTFENLPIISDAVADLWLASMPKPKKAGDVPDPPQPAR